MSMKLRHRMGDHFFKPGASLATWHACLTEAQRTAKCKLKMLLARALSQVQQDVIVTPLGLLPHNDNSHTQPKQQARALVLDCTFAITQLIKIGRYIAITS